MDILYYEDKYKDILNNYNIIIININDFLTDKQKKYTKEKQYNIVKKLQINLENKDYIHIYCDFPSKSSILF
jgi:hypothetical protein